MQVDTSVAKWVMEVMSVVAKGVRNGIVSTGSTASA